MAHPIGTRDLLIKGGRIIDPSQGLDAVGDVLLRNGLVEACGGALGTPDGAEVIDATGLVVAPGFIDVHVHLREPGREDVETVASGAHSAVAGQVIAFELFGKVALLEALRIAPDGANHRRPGPLDHQNAAAAIGHVMALLIDDGGGDAGQRQGAGAGHQRGGAG
jgi:hypothetical protein